ncbi:O-antigen ligase family protein [Bacillaceae bacterium W0354]
MNEKHTMTYYLVLLNLIIIPLFPWKTYIGPIPLAAEVVLIPLLVLGFLWDVKNKKIKLNDVPYKTFAILFGIFFIVQVISLTQAIDLMSGLMEIARYLSYAFLFLIVATVTFEKREYIHFGIAFLIAMAIATTYGALQYMFDWNLNKAGVYALSEAYGRVQSLTMNPNYWAGLINFIIPGVLLIVVVFLKNKWQQLAVITLFGLLVINQILTYTRSAWMIMFLAIIMVALFVPKKFFKNVVKLQILIPLIILAVVVFNLPDFQDRTKSAIYVAKSFMPDSFAEKLMPEGDGDGEETEEERWKRVTSEHALVSRTTLWKTGWTMYKENPTLGVGIGNYTANYKDVVTRHEELYVGHDSYSVHNSYLKVMAETGTFGIITFMLIYIYYYLYIGKLYLQTRKDLISQLLLIGLFIGSGTFMGQNLANNLVFIPQINVIFWLVSGLIFNYIIVKQRKDTAKA